MPASLTRKERRLCIGANRKLCTIRWIGKTTVGVVLCSPWRTGLFNQAYREKADDGAEKSYPKMHKGKRRRGQRRGKARSRGDKPRSNEPRRPSTSKGEAARRINHSGRKFIWGERTRGKLVKSSYFGHLDKSLSRLSVETENERVIATDIISVTWRAHLRILRARARTIGIPDGANPFGKSALDFVLVNSCHHAEMAWHDILGGLQFDRSPAAFHEFAAGEDERTDESVLPLGDEHLPSSGGGKETSRKKPRRKKGNLGPQRSNDLSAQAIVRPVISGVVRPWERRGARNQRRGRPSENDLDS